MGLGIKSRILAFFSLEKYAGVSVGQLIINFIFQRIFRINSKATTSIHFTSKVDGFSNMVIGKNVHTSFAVSGGCYLDAKDGTTLEIGEDTIWAWNFCIQTANHDLYDRKRYIKKSIRIGKNCWFGNSVTVCPGVTLGDNVTVGANSVVTKSFPSNVVIAGCPAKIIKHLNN